MSNLGDEEDYQKYIQKLLNDTNNPKCADCNETGDDITWASTNLGIYVCTDCSGQHRNLGTHITKIRSITLDTWNKYQYTEFRKN
jgi:stromal membrane-associated protein